MAYCSIGAGVLVPKRDTVRPADVVFLYDGPEADPAVTHHVLSLIDDWEIIEGNDAEDLMSKFMAECQLDRAVSYALVALEGTPTDLECDILEYLEGPFHMQVDWNAVFDRLIVAPLRDPERAGVLAKVALSHNFPATASLFEMLSDCQPLLRRLVAHWLDLAMDNFASLPVSKSRLWIIACSSGAVRRSFEAESRSAFQTDWNSIVFNQAICPTTASRIAFGRIVSELAQRLFPTEGAVFRANIRDTDVNGDTEGELLENTNPHQSYERVCRQIDVITRAIADAEDAKATTFLHELIDEQRKVQGGDKRAVKSLCNVANRCADLFRTDFERRCLDFALEIRDNDPWTLRQFADHLKRIGEFDAAIHTYEKAASLGESVASQSGIADVWSEKGEYGKAIELYKQIPDWEEDPVLRTAIADNLRRLGEFDAADQEYRSIMSRGVGMEFSRARAGQADIARKRGNLREALEVYRSLVGTPDERSQRIYRVIVSDLLKQLGELEDALRVADGLVQDAPFFLQARIQRGCILGMLGKDQEALSGIPEGEAPRAFGEWVRGYYRGLLLFKLGRFADARNELTEGLASALDQGDNRAIMRLGAAFVYLHSGDLDLARGELDCVQVIGDSYAQHLREVLRLHLAVVRKDRRAISEYSRKLDEEQGMIREAVHSLLVGSMMAAFNAEANLLLGISPDLTIAV